MEKDFSEYLVGIFGWLILIYGYAIVIAFIAAACFAIIQPCTI